MKIAIGSIRVPSKRRPLRDVQSLAQSIREVGLLNPITVAPDHTLIAGYHRLEACKLLGWTDIEVTICGWGGLRAELAEIDENLIRNELDTLERGEQLARRKVIYEALYPSAKPGVKRAAGMNRAMGNNVDDIVTPTFVENTTRHTGQSGRAIQRLVQIVTDIPDDLRDQLHETPTADSQKELLTIARLKNEPAKQREVVDRVVNGSARNVLHATQQIKHEEMAPAPAIVTVALTRFQVIYADPPWQYDHQITENRAIENQYPTMPLEDICALQVPADDDAILFLWATNPKLAEAMRVIDAWGFSYRTNMVWVKDKWGQGHYVRSQHELLLIARKGEFPKPLDSGNISSVLNAPRTEHSAKPHEVYEIIERMYPHASKVELFARNTREGWNGWGNQYDAGRKQVA